MHFSYPSSALDKTGIVRAKSIVHALDALTNIYIRIPARLKYPIRERFVKGEKGSESVNEGLECKSAQRGEGGNADEKNERVGKKLLYLLFIPRLKAFLMGAKIA